MGHVGPKTRSLDHIVEKPFVCSGDKVFGLILMKLMKSCTCLKMDHVG